MKKNLTELTNRSVGYKEVWFAVVMPAGTASVLYFSTLVPTLHVGKTTVFNQHKPQALFFPFFVGMFATVDGISQRAPVHWSENVIGAALCFPYVVALDDEFITVHSMLDQQQKQTLPFKEGHILQDFEGIRKDAFLHQ